MITPFNKQYQILFATFLVSILAIATIVLLYPRQEKYKIETIEKQEKQKNQFTFYQDLDNDGISEKIRFDSNFLGMSSIIVFYQNKILYQHNFSKKFGRSEFFGFGDFDNNNKQEFYIFMHTPDSIFLHVIDAYTGEPIIKDLFIDTYSLSNGTIDYSIRKPQLVNLDGAKNKQLLFSIFCGFSKSIRHTFKVNIDQGHVVKSPEAGCSIDERLMAFDIDGDSKKEIFGEFSLYGNYEDDYPYSDMFGWLKVYNSDLSFKFDPHIIGKYPGIITTVPLMGSRFAAIYEYRGIENDTSFIGIYNSQGKVLTKKALNSSPFRDILMIESIPHDKPQNLKIVFANGDIEFYNTKLDIIKTDQIGTYNAIIANFDLNQNGKKEFIVKSPGSEDLIITDWELKNPIKLPYNDHIYRYLSVKELSNNENLLCICSNNSNNLYKYIINIHNMFYWLYMFLIWLFIFGILLVLGKLNKNYIQKRYENEKVMGEIQLRAIKNQLDPHFTFNILNSIGALYSQNNIEKANLMLGKYSKLLRQAVFQSGSTETTIKEELNYVENYIVLEQIRFNNSFEYSIKIDRDIKQNISLPKLLIHGFVENAIKHGLRHLKQNGKLEIKAMLENRATKISISDNGIGRAKAKQYSSLSTGKGLEIVNQTLDLYFKLKNVKIQYNIIDLYDEAKNPTGTKVEITIPE